MAMVSGALTASSSQTAVEDLQEDDVNKPSQGVKSYLLRPTSTTCHPSKQTFHCISTVIATTGCQYFNCRFCELNCCESL